MKPRFNVDLFFSGIYESRILLEKIEKSMTRLVELQSPMLQAHLPEAICSLTGLLDKIIVRCHRDTHRFIGTLADMMEQLRYYDYMGIGSDEYHQLRAEKQYSLGIRFKGALVKLQKLLGHCNNLFHERLLALLVETVPSSEIDQLRELLNTEAFDLKLNAISVDDVETAGLIKELRHLIHSISGDTEGLKKAIRTVSDLIEAHREFLFVVEKRLSGKGFSSKYAPPQSIWSRLWGRLTSVLTNRSQLIQRKVCL